MTMYSVILLLYNIICYNAGLSFPLFPLMVIYEVCSVLSLTQRQASVMFLLQLQ